VQSLRITTKVVSSNPANGEVYSIQYYVIRSVSDLLQVGGFIRVLHHITEILLKVMLNSIPLSLTVYRIINTSL
jgi:hypothetical protein